MSAPGLQGLRPWIVQRISAVFIAVYIIYFALTVLFANPLSIENWATWVAWPANNIAMGLFIVALLWHAWIGIRDVILDYIPGVVTRMLVLTIVASILAGSGFWGVRALFFVARA
jgi:succinate dehydrogenase / fumarate reductase, membrane anchor subunit